MPWNFSSADLLLIWVRNMSFSMALTRRRSLLMLAHAGECRYVPGVVLQLTATIVGIFCAALKARRDQ
jgi:hypothetical protein